MKDSTDSENKRLKLDSSTLNTAEDIESQREMKNVHMETEIVKQTSNTIPLLKQSVDAESNDTQVPFLHKADVFKGESSKEFKLEKSNVTDCLGIKECPVKKELEAETSPENEAKMKQVKVGHGIISNIDLVNDIDNKASSTINVLEKETNDEIVDHIDKNEKITNNFRDDQSSKINLL